MDEMERIEHVQDSFRKVLMERLHELREKKGVSEAQMSLDLSWSKSYIQHITSGRMLPSMSRFIEICAFLDVTPSEFFDTDNHYPQEIKRLIRDCKYLTKEELTLVEALIRRIRNVGWQDVKIILPENIKDE